MKSEREVALNHPEPENQSMALPEGKNCGDCANFPRCQAFIGLEEENEVCDWYPNRFISIKGLFMKG